MLRTVALLFFTLSLLVGCASTHHYRYTPPQNPYDTECTSRCSTGKHYCEQLCQYKYASCTQHPRLFQICKRTCDCTSSYNVCYEACGGQVTEGFL